MHLMLTAGAAVAVDWTRIEALAADVKNKGDSPIVVIGAGLGGLVSAAYLANHGFPVTLLVGFIVIFLTLSGVVDQFGGLFNQGIGFAQTLLAGGP